MSNRKKKRIDFIAASSWQNAMSASVAGDASNRSYDRLTKSDGRTAILMNAPPEKGEDVLPFVKILTHLRDSGLEAPKLLAADREHGFLLLEDLGDALFARICKADQSLEKILYQEAIDVLLQLHRTKAPNDVAPYDLATYLREAFLVIDWYLPSATGQPPRQSVVDEFRENLTTLCNAIEQTSPVLVLRDYHAENLLWLPEREGVKKVGLLDFQDALIGHPAYDLVSLLEDARRDTSKALQVTMKSYFIENSDVDAGSFNYAYAVLGAQRNLKIIGIFARLCLRDAKPQYIDLIPRVWAHLQNDLSHPKLENLRGWVDEHMQPPTPETLSRIKEARNAT